MTTITKALDSLGIKDWSLDGIPTNEQEFLEKFTKYTELSYDEYGIPTPVSKSNDPSDFGVTWSQIVAEQQRLEELEPLRMLREERNKKIAETDWWAVSDRTMTTQQTTYRQALRDITDTYTSLDDVVWPVKPE